MLASATGLAGGSDSFTVQGGASIEIGKMGGPAAGSFTLDAGKTLTDGGSISAPQIVINGTLAVGDAEHLTLSGGVVDHYDYNLGRWIYSDGLTGAGMLTIGSHAELDIQNGVDPTGTESIKFTGTAGVLGINPSALTSSNAFVPKIAGFAPGDEIVYDGAASGISYSGGTLTLLNGASAVATFSLAGNYAGDTFAETQNSSGNAVITVSNGSAAAPQVFVPATVFAVPKVTGPVPSVAVYEATVIPTITVTVTDTVGILTANTSVSGGGGSIKGSGSKTLTIKGTLAQVDADLTTLAYDNPSGLADTIQVSANNGLGGVTTQNIPVTIVPTVAISVSPGVVNLAKSTATVTFTFTFTFSQAPTDFSLSDVTWTTADGTLTNLGGSGTVYTATFTANTAGGGVDDSAASIAVTNHSYHNSSGVAGVGGSATFTVDSVTPTVKVGINNTDVNVANGTATVTFTFSEAPKSLTLANLSAVGGTLSNLFGSGTVYTATFSGNPAIDISTASVSVKANWKESNGNPGLGGTSPAFTVDTVTPTVTKVLSSVASGGEVTTGHSVRISLGISEAVSVTGTRSCCSTTAAPRPTIPLIRTRSCSPSTTWPGPRRRATSWSAGSSLARPSPLPRATGTRSISPAPAPILDWASTSPRAAPPVQAAGI
jgi:hypothetical protein